MPHFLIISLLLLFLSSFPQAISGYEANYYAPNSVLSSGRWVKIAVDTTGIHQISYATLRQWGFDNPENVSVYGYGAVQGSYNTFTDYPDDLPRQHTLRTDDERLLFYAEGSVSVEAPNTGAPKVTRNYYSDRSYYFLTDSHSGPDAELLEYVANPSHIQDYALYVDYREKETRNYGEGGALFHGPEITAETPDLYNFRVRNLAQGDVSVRLSGIIRLATGSASIKPEFEGAVGKVKFSAINIQPVISDNKIWTSFTGSGTLSSSEEFPLQDASVNMSIPAPSNFSGTLLALDYATFIYRRTLRMEADVPQLLTQIALQPVRNLNLQYTNVPQHFHVWDVTTPWAVRPFEVKPGTGGSLITAQYRPNTSTRLVAFDAAASFAEPEFVGEVSNQNLHSSPVSDMVIITTPLFESAAEELASINRARGMDVQVVLQSDIFNEFGSGAPSAAAIRRFNKMYYDRDVNKDKFRFVTICGAATWDPRHLTREWPDYPLAYLAEEPIHAQETAANFANDAYFGILSDASTTEALIRLKMNVAVGRIPARALSEATDYNAKVRAHLAASPSPAVYLRAITTSGDGDNFQHFDHNTALSDTLSKYNPNIMIRRADELFFPERKSGTDWDATRSIADAFEQGCGFFSYCGHANPQSLGNDIWDIRANKKYSNERFPLAMLATCYVIPFDRMQGIGDRMLFKADGGVIGAIGACRSVYLDRNKILSYAVARAYSEAKPGTTMGEVFSIARSMLVDKGMTSQLGANTMCYNYIGDPSMPMCIPEGSIVVDRLFGAPIQGGEMVAPGIICSISGYVQNPDGTVMTDFNGPLTLDLYQAPLSVATRVQDGIQRTKALEDVILGSFTATVEQGRFTARMPLPVSSVPWVAGRTLLTAVDSATGKPVAGVMVGPGIGSSYIEDSQAAPAPEIAVFEVDEYSMNHDGTVGANFDLNISIYAPAELADGHSNFMRRASLRLDNKHLDFDPTEGLPADNDGYYTITVPMTVDAPGAHTLYLSATDRFGRSTASAIEFTVASYRESARLSVDAPEGFVRTVADFDVESAKHTPSGRLIITDSQGNTVLTKADVTFPYSWDLRNDDGTPVPSGPYKAALHSTTHTVPPVPFTVIRPN